MSNLGFLYFYVNGWRIDVGSEKIKMDSSVLISIDWFIKMTLSY
jgi:hypothetical protein